MSKQELHEKSELLKKSLKIVDELAKSDLGDIDEKSFTNNDFDYEKLQELIDKSRKLTKSIYWKLQ